MTPLDGPSTGGSQLAPAVQAVLTLGDLLENRALGLTPVTAVDPTVRVRGAHSIEIADAGRWLPPGFVVLTTGLRLAGEARPGPGAAVDPEVARALVQDLVHARAAALLFGVGLSFAQVPATLVAAAERAGLPVIEIPGHVPFWQVEDFVQSSLRSRDAYRLQRTLWLQNDLLEALAQEQPVAAVVARLAGLVGGTATVFEVSGRIVASTGAGPARLIWAELRARGLSPSRFAVGRWAVASRTVSVRGVTYAVALASRREEVLDDLGEMLLETAARLLSAVGGAKALGTTQARADAAQLLAALRAGVTPEEAMRLWERLRGFRFAPQLPLRAFCALPVGSDAAEPRGPAGRPRPARPVASSGFIGPKGPTGSSGTAGLSRPVGAQLGDERWLGLHEEAATLGLPVLMRAETEATPDLPPGALWGLAADSPELPEWLDSLTGTHHVGLSEAYTSLPATRARLREADRAVAIAARRPAPHGAIAAGVSTPDGAATPRAEQASRAGSARGVVVRFEDLDLATWLLSAQDESALANKSAQYLGALLAHESLRETAVSYLAHDLDIAATAQALFLHPNSVRYRLARIGELLGAPVCSPAIIANLYLAFHDDLALAAGRDAPVSAPRAP